MNGSNSIGGALTLAVAVFTAGVAMAGPPPSETVAPLLQHLIPNLPGKRLTAVNVVFPPGARSLPHRHGSAFLFAYVLAGDIRSQIEGEPAHTYHTGDSWTEKPGDHHVLSENVSSTVAARLLVVFISNDRVPIKTDDTPEEH